MAAEVAAICYLRISQVLPGLQHFVIIAFAIFLVIQPINRLKKAPSPAPRVP
jgi:large-conductance mechanosensitive channel